jgi:hypothetical protein
VILTGYFCSDFANSEFVRWNSRAWDIKVKAFTTFYSSHPMNDYIYRCVFVKNTTVIFISKTAGRRARGMSTAQR